VVVRQNKTIFSAEFLKSRALSLRAPVSGGMTRLIRESPSCSVRYRLIKNGRVVFDFVSDHASFEQEWENGKT
jgi:hypothetical protein